MLLELLFDYIFFTDTSCYMAFLVVTVLWKKNLKFDPMRGGTSCFLTGVTSHFVPMDLFCCFVPLQIKRTDNFSADTFQQNWPGNCKSLVYSCKYCD